MWQCLLDLTVYVWIVGVVAPDPPLPDAAPGPAPEPVPDRAGVLDPAPEPVPDPAQVLAPAPDDPDPAQVLVPAQVPDHVAVWP